jgi:hypothetical protein
LKEEERRRINDLVRINALQNFPSFIEQPALDQIATIKQTDIGQKKRVASLLLQEVGSRRGQAGRNGITFILQLQDIWISDRKRLDHKFQKPIWRAVGIDRTEDLPTDNRGADVLLLEAKPPADATRPGGNATRFDWSLLRGWSAPAPWVLAGGLTPANVAGAIQATGAAAVDVSSGVESARGVKDPALIQAFIANARGG